MPTIEPTEFPRVDDWPDGRIADYIVDHWDEVTAPLSAEFWVGVLNATGPHGDAAATIWTLVGRARMLGPGPEVGHVVVMLARKLAAPTAPTFPGRRRVTCDELVAIVEWEFRPDADHDGSDAAGIRAAALDTVRGFHAAGRAVVVYENEDLGSPNVGARVFLPLDEGDPWPAAGPAGAWGSSWQMFPRYVCPGSFELPPGAPLV